MKSMLCLLTLLCLCALSSFPTHAQAERPPKAFKGIELYSWLEKDGTWRYILLQGTNRQKDEEEVKESKNPFKEVTTLAKAFTELAEGESVAWIEMKGCPIPPAKIRDEIEKVAQKAKIELHTSSRKS